MTTEPIPGSEVAQVAALNRMLAQAETVADFANIVDAAEVARVMAKRAHLGTDAVNAATVGKLDALCGLADAVDAGQADGTLASRGQPSESNVTAGNITSLATALGLKVSAANVLVHRARLVRLARPASGDWLDLRDGDELRTADVLKAGRDIRKAEDQAKARADAEEAAAVRMWLRAEQAWLRHREMEEHPERFRVIDISSAPEEEWSDVLGWEDSSEQVTSLEAATVHQMPATELLDKLAGAGVDLLITDPPYASDVEDIEAFVADWLPRAFGALDGLRGRAYICTGAYDDEQRAYLDCFASCVPPGWSAQMLVWHYPDTLGPSPSQRYKTAHQVIWHLYGPDAPRLLSDRLTETTTVHVLPMMRVDTAGGRLFSWQKPDSLARRLIGHAAVRGSLVVDPFAGTGTFLVAAAEAGCKAIGSEIDPDRLADCRMRGIDVT